MISTRLGERYELVAELGRGGMGVVYRAKDPRLDREVAVKVFAAEGPETSREARFRREARLVAKLDHPAIVPVFDFGRHEDSLFFVMPVLAGETLSTLLRRQALNLGEALEVLARVAEALDHSAARGVVHRDVKPANVMVSRTRDGDLRVRVMDFGLAWTAAPGKLTEPDQLPGTLHYLSPEHVMSLDVDGRADLFSLGAILYECLAGEPPFTGSSRAAVLYKIVHQEPPSLPEPADDEELERLITWCLAKEPEDRPARGRELAAALRRCRQQLGDIADLGVPLSDAAGGLRVRKRDRLPFIGRKTELGHLEKSLDAAVAGEGQVVLIGGEIGSGKTRLLEELERRCRRRRIPVLHGRFLDHEGTFPHHGFCELIQDYFRPRFPTSRLSRLGSESTSTESKAADLDLGDLAADLKSLFPILRELPAVRDAASVHDTVVDTAAAAKTADAESDIDAEGVQVYELLAQTLIRLASGSPLVLMLENLHAGGASLEALEYVVRRLRPTPTLIVGTFHPDEAPKGHPLSRFLRRFAGDPRSRSFQLGPLSRDEIRELVSAWLGDGAGRHEARAVDDLAERLAEAADGHPLFTCELLRSAIESGDQASSDSASSSHIDQLSYPLVIAGQLPETIQHVVEARLDRLPDELSRILAVASILGREFEVDELAELVADRDATEDAVDRLIDAGLLEEDRRSRGARVHFSSGLVRDVLHDGLSRRRRRRLHRRYAELLERRNQGRLDRVYPRLVHHFSQGDAPLETVTYALMLARMSAGAVAPDDTIRATRVALEFLEDHDLDSGGEVEGELRLLSATASRRVGDVEGAWREAVKATAALQRSGELKAAAEAALVAAETAWQLRRVDDNRRWLRRAVDLARSGEAGAVLRQALTFAATVANLRGDHARARELLAEVESRRSGRHRRGATSGHTGSLSSSVSSSMSSSATRDPATLRIPLPSAFDSLEPALALYVEPAEVVPNVFETLTRVEEGARIAPCLAAKFEAEDGGRRFRFELRRDVRFHDGRPLTARDVRYSFERLLRLPFPGVETALLPLRGVRAFRDGTASELRGFDILSTHVFVLELDEPLSFFPSKLTNPMTAIVAEGSDSFDRDWRQGCVGTGPFRLVRCQAGRRIDLEAHPQYWRPDRPMCRRLTFELGVDAQRAVAGFRDGSFSLASHLSSPDAEALQQTREYADGARESPAFATYFLLLNARRGPFADIAVRRALCSRLDTAGIVRSTLGREAVPAPGLIPPGLLGYEPSSQRAGVDSSDESIDDAGLGALIGLELRVSAHPAYSRQYGDVWQGLTGALSELGIDLEVTQRPMAEILQEIQEAEVDLVAARRIAAYPDSDAMVSLLHSRDGLLGTFLGDGRIDRWIEQGRAETDPELRHATYRRLEDHLRREALLVPLFDAQIRCFARPEIRGLRLRLGWPRIAYEDLARDD